MASIKDYINTNEDYVRKLAKKFRHEHQIIIYEPDFFGQTIKNAEKMLEKKLSVFPDINAKETARILAEDRYKVAGREIKAFQNLSNLQDYKAPEALTIHTPLDNGVKISMIFFNPGLASEYLQKVYFLHEVGHTMQPTEYWIGVDQRPHDLVVLETEPDVFAMLYAAAESFENGDSLRAALMRAKSRIFGLRAVRMAKQNIYTMTGNFNPYALGLLNEHVIAEIKKLSDATYRRKFMQHGKLSFEKVFEFSSNLVRTEFSDLQNIEKLEKSFVSKKIRAYHKAVKGLAL